MFTIEQHLPNSFECTFDQTRYLVMIEKDRTSIVVWNWMDELEVWNDLSTSSLDALDNGVVRHIALELYLVYNILLDGFEYLSPSDRARKRAMAEAMKGFAR